MCATKLIERDDACYFINPGVLIDKHPELLCVMIKPDIKKFTLSYDYAPTNKTMFLYGEQVEELYLPPNITTITSEFMGNFPNVRKIRFIYGNVQRFEEGAFQHCHHLVDMVIPESVYYIGRNAFHWMSDAEKQNKDRQSAERYFITDEKRKIHTFLGKRVNRKKDSSLKTINRKSDDFYYAAKNIAWAFNTMGGNLSNIDIYVTDNYLRSDDANWFDMADHVHCVSDLRLLTTADIIRKLNCYFTPSTEVETVSNTTDR